MLAQGSEDLVGRLGGEEFVVVMPNTDGDSARAAAERIRVAFADTPMPIEGRDMAISVSVGVALLVAGSRSLQRPVERFSPSPITSIRPSRQSVPCISAAVRSGVWSV